MTLHEIYDEYDPGSEGFCRAVETHCGYQMTREEIERIGDVAKTPEEFDRIWEDHGWWCDSAELRFEWTARRDADDADEARGIQAAEDYCKAQGIDPKTAFGAFSRSIMLDARDRKAEDRWNAVESAAIDAMCEGWHRPTENASLVVQ
jgi:hypothetical protein